VVWTGFVWLRIGTRLRALGITEINLLLPKKCREILEYRDK
jgi:hypothetical protein